MTDKISQYNDEDLHEGEYILFFTEEAIFNPIYEDWVGGRIEVEIPHEKWAIDEIRFFAPRTKEWVDFREKYDTKWISKEVLEEVERTVKEKFYVELN